MKNVINYYYDLYPKDIRQTKDFYTFTVEKNQYFFLTYKGKNEDIDNIYEKLSKFYYFRLYIHQI